MQSYTQTEAQSNIPIQFSELINSFNKKGWKLSNSDPNHYVFKKSPISPMNLMSLDTFELLTNKNEIIVKVPLRILNNNEFLFSTKFKSYYEAISFLEMHLDIYEENKKEDKEKNNHLI